MSYIILNGVKVYTATGNSLALSKTVPAVPLDLQILGETLCKKAVFAATTVRIDGVASLPFTAGASLTFAGFNTTANNKTVVLTSISGLVMTFPAATFTAATELVGTITDGTDTVDIAVSASAQQVLTSLTSFGCVLKSKNVIDVNKSFPQTVSGITVSYNEDTKEFTLSGTASADANIYIYQSTANRLYLPKQHALSVTRISGTNSAAVNVIGRHTYLLGQIESPITASLLTSGANASVTGVFTRPEFYSDDLRFLISNGSALVGLVLKLQLEIGSAATAWESPQAITAAITLQDTAAPTPNQLTLAGRALTYNADGTSATWYGQDKIVKVNSVWYHRQIGEFEADATERADFWTLLAEPVDTELCAADQAALASVEKTYAGITNIMLSDSKGQVYIKYRARR